MDQEFFRKEAIEAQARIDRLPRSMRVTGGMTRFLLSGLAVALTGAVGWSHFVEVPVRVHGNGLLIDTSGDLLKQVRAPMEGIVDQLLISEGLPVKAGQPLVRLRLHEREAELEKAERNLRSLREQQERTLRLQEVERNGEDRARQVKVRSLDKRIAEQQLWLEENRKQSRHIDELSRQGLTTNSQVLAATETLLKTTAELSTAKGELSALLADVLVAAGRRERERLNLQLEVDQAMAQIANLKREIARGSTLTSPVDGTIAEIAADRTGLVGAGQVVISIMPSNSDSRVDAIAYISLADGKLVSPGAEVLVKPAALPNGEQGRIRASVDSISEAPVSERALDRVLGNKALVEQTTRNGSPFAVKIRLQKDSSTPTGYSWTSGIGPDIALTTGTPVDVTITTEKVSLLSLALPALRNLLSAEAQAAGRTH